VYTRAELTMIAELCQEFDVTVISDEVYEHLIFDDVEHIAIASLPGMFERTLTIGSAGKSFGMTGWKIGWVYGHPDLVKGMAQAHQFIAFAANAPAQAAVAHAFTIPSSYYEDYRSMYISKRDILMQGLSASGLKAFNPQGTYFIMADFSDVFDGDDVAFSRHLITEIGVAGIPPSSFYSPEHRHLGNKQLRFSFCKSDEMLLEAGNRLAKLSGK
jgi:N-succinyldiaminopimelate aminotransferase